MTILLRHIRPLLALVITLTTLVHGQVVQDDPEELKGIDVVEHLGEEIPLDLAFVNGGGDTVTLQTYFEDGRPVILILGYYTCPMLCNLVFNGVAETAKEMAWTPGREYQIVSVSIDSTETSLIAGAKQENYIASLDKPGADDGWAFLVGAADQSRALADAIGFEYFWVEENQQYAHPAVITVLSPKGKISRYLYGIQFPERDLRMALIEASEGKVGSTIDRIILSCYHYDPQAGGYVLFAGGLMRIGGFATVAALGVLIGGMVWRDRRRRRKEVATRG